MELTITNLEENNLIGRKEVTAVVKFEGPTPTKKEITSLLSQELKTDGKLCILNHVYNQFGKTQADVTAYVYLNKKILEQFEGVQPEEKKEEKEVAKEESPKEVKPEAKDEKPAETKEEMKEETPKGEEAPKEEKKEEKPKEEDKPEVKAAPKEENKPAEEKKE
jgi:colicin import membrane protein